MDIAIVCIVLALLAFFAIILFRATLRAAFPPKLPRDGGPDA